MKQSIVLLFTLTICVNLSGQERISHFDEYVQQRDSLIAEANTMNFVDKVSLSEDEEKVNVYLKSLLAKEFSHPPFLPSRNFLECQKEIEKSSLYSFLQRMPKGAILHAHAQALGDLHWLVKTATYRPDCYMYVGENKEKLVKGMVRIFETLPTGSWELVQDVRQKSGNIALFDQKMYESFALSIKDLSHPPVWPKFQNCFRCFVGLIADKDLYKTFIKNALLQLIQEDNVQHIELRDAPQENLILMYKEVIEEIRECAPYFSLKIICSASRDKERATVMESVVEALKLRKKYPDIIAGLDLTGEEDAGHPIFYYIEDLLELNRLSEQEHLVLPYYFHGGETPLPFDSYIQQDERAGHSPIPFNDNLYDVLLLHSKRVGHGLSLVKNPFLMNKFKQAGIAIETCPVSNQILGYVEDLRNHPALTYLNAGLAVTINPDDPGIFGYKGVTPDFWEACVAWELDLRALKKLAINSIVYSSLDAKKKENLLIVWEQRWNEFISAMLQKATAHEDEAPISERGHGVAHCEIHETSFETSERR